MGVVGSPRAESSQRTSRSLSVVLRTFLRASSILCTIVLVRTRFRPRVSGAPRWYVSHLRARRTSKVCVEPHRHNVRKFQWADVQSCFNVFILIFSGPLPSPVTMCSSLSSAEAAPRSPRRPVICHWGRSVCVAHPPDLCQVGCSHATLRALLRQHLVDLNGRLTSWKPEKTLAGYTGASFQRSTRAGSNADVPQFAVPFQVNPVWPVSTVRALRLHPIQFCVGQMRGHCRVHDTSGQNTRLLVGSNLGQNRNTS